LFAGILACLGMTSAHAQSVLDRVRAENTLRCGSLPRTGFAEGAPNAAVSGPALGLCRGVAMHLLGPSGKIKFRLYDDDPLSDAMTDFPGDELAFLSITANDALARIYKRSAIVVFPDWISLIVPDTSPIKTLRDLAQRRVCLLIGSSGQQAMDTYDRQFDLRVARLAFQEDVEMRDAYNVGRCDALVALRSDLEEINRAPGINRVHSGSILDLDRDPLYLATPVADPQWANLVARLMSDANRPDR
jgi:ABC-type amino acid transport substrate-binding protein